MNNHDRLIAAAHALTHALREKVVFVGGCTVHLYLDNDQGRVDVRPTEDVDVILEVYHLIEWYKLEDEIRQAGFQQNATEDGPICRYRKGSIIIDFMPTEESVLGFSNPWYPDAIKAYQVVEIVNSLNIRFIRLEYFLLTKFAAYEGRGNGDLLSSKDIEDILMVIAGRRSIEGELLTLSGPLKEALLINFTRLFNHNDFNYAVSGAFPTSTTTADLVKARVNNLVMRLRFL